MSTLRVFLFFQTFDLDADMLFLSAAWLFHSSFTALLCNMCTIMRLECECLFNTGFDGDTDGDHLLLRDG